MSCCEGRTASADQADGGASPAGRARARMAACHPIGAVLRDRHAGRDVGRLVQECVRPVIHACPSIPAFGRARVTGVVAHDDGPLRRQADQPDLEGAARAPRASRCARLSRDLASIAPALAPKVPLHAAHRTPRVEKRTTRLALAALDETVHERAIDGLDPDLADGVRAAGGACAEPLSACEPLAGHAESVAARAPDRYGVRRCPVACAQESHGRGGTHAVWRPRSPRRRPRVRTRPSWAPPTR